MAAFWLPTRLWMAWSFVPFVLQRRQMRLVELRSELALRKRCTITEVKRRRTKGRATRKRKQEKKNLGGLAR